MMLWLAAAEYHYARPFEQPLYGAWNYWYFLMLPLCLAVAIVYKAIRCSEMKMVWREAAAAFLWIVGGIILAGLLLAGLVHVI